MFLKISAGLIYDLILAGNNETTVFSLLGDRKRFLKYSLSNPSVSHYFIRSLLHVLTRSRSEGTGCAQSCCFIVTLSCRL